MRRFHLPEPLSTDVLCEQDLPIAMDDGAVLLADRWVIRATRDRPQPTVVVRSPYGRRGAFGVLFGRMLAERGLQVILQSVRGTFGSGGRFNPFEERDDGLDTLRWLRRQPWHSGRIGMTGPSYMGLVQWAVALDAGDDLAALAIQVSASQFHGQVFAGGSLSLETAASWLALVAAQERRFAPVAMVRAIRQLPGILSELPLGELDRRATGTEVDWFREAITNVNREDAYWVARDFAAGVASVRAPVQLIGGWYDIFLPWMLEDFRALRGAGNNPQLVIGPWTHTAPGLVREGLRNGLAWLRAHLLDDQRLLRQAPVRVFVTGERARGGWRDLTDWPPPGTGERRLYLTGGGGLREGAAEDASRADRYRYNPVDPTPSLGGPVLLARQPVVDNRPLEARPDVLTFTTAPLAQAIEAIGPARVELWVRTNSPYFDLFARVCDVDRAGASWNVCDALERLDARRLEHSGEDYAVHVAFDLWPLAHRFAPGNRIRLQVSSGAHPRYARNPGTGEEYANATQLRAVDVEILHGAARPSMLVLPAGDG